MFQVKRLSKNKNISLQLKISFKGNRQITPKYFLFLLRLRICVYRPGGVTSYVQNADSTVRSCPQTVRSCSRFLKSRAFSPICPKKQKTLNMATQQNPVRAGPGPMEKHLKRKRTTRISNPKNEKMKTPKLITNYSYMSDTDLASLATRTVDALQTNTSFPDLNPSFAEYESVALDYVAKQAITANGRASGMQKEEKDEARTAVLKLMRRAASYINNFTEISSIQLSSGFLPARDPKRGRAPDAPSWTWIRRSNRPAEILLGFEAVREAYQYEIQIAEDLDEQGNPIWQSLPLISDSRGNYYAPVADGIRYHFRVRSLNRHGRSAWSPVASRTAWVD